MSTVLWKVRTSAGASWAVGPIEKGPSELLESGMSLDVLLGPEGPRLTELDQLPTAGPVPPSSRLLAPAGSQPVWAAGVTYERSRDARRAESSSPDHYDHVYEAERPELFLKALPGAVRGPGQPVAIRSDSTWDVPEPELALVIDSSGQIVGYTIGNDMSSRSIEGENPLYLPQAKLYRGACSMGPAIVPRQGAEDLADKVIEMTITRNGDTVFRDLLPVNRMYRRTEDLASWLNRAQDHPSGVLLLTGTALVPPSDFTLHAGDVVHITITGLGCLTNPVERIEVG